MRIVSVPVDGSCGFTVVAVAMDIIQPPLFDWSISHTHQTSDLLSQLKTLAVTHVLHHNDVMQLYSEEFSFIQGVTDLLDEIGNTLQPTLNEDLPAPGKVVPIHF
jgi:dGTP triphosphohydrolase